MAFDPAAYARDIEAEARRGGWALHHLAPIDGFARPWLERAALAGPGAPALYLSAGIHGDEIAGPLAVLEMLRRPGFFDRCAMTIFPILNPVGLTRATRENGGGIDLNRDYRGPKSDETRGHLAVLTTLGRFDASILLHEDFEGTGAYLYELNEIAPDLGRKIIAAMERHVPIDERPVIEEVEAERGVLLRRRLIEKHGPIEDRPDWPEAIYLSVHHTNVSYTTETPMLQPLEKRVAAQVAAVETLIAALPLAPLPSA
jgi:hypothetical protein